MYLRFYSVRKYYFRYSESHNYVCDARDVNTYIDMTQFCKIFSIISYKLIPHLYIHIMKWCSFDNSVYKVGYYVPI